MNLLRERMGPLFTENRLDLRHSTDMASLGNLRRAIPIYRLPDQPDAGLVNKIGAILMAHGNSQSEDILQWQSWVLSFLCLGFPAFATTFTREHLSEYSIVPYPNEFLHSVQTVCNNLVADPNLNHITPSIDSFPAPNGLIGIEYYNCADIDGLYGYLALIVHLMGKQITAGTRDVMEVRRPKSIIDTFSCADMAYVLNGPGKLGRKAHNMIHTAWSASDRPRQIFIEKFCKYRWSSERAVRIVFLMFGMLEYSGMQSAAFIHALLVACPWVINEIPLLAPAFTFYEASMIAFANAEADFRPYIKLYHGNASHIFHSKALQDLNAVACMWLTSVLPSMKDYETVGGEAAKKAFSDLLKAKGLETTYLTAEVITAPVEVQAST